MFPFLMLFSDLLSHLELNFKSYHVLLDSVWSDLCRALQNLLNSLPSSHGTFLQMFIYAKIFPEGLSGMLILSVADRSIWLCSLLSLREPLCLAPAPAMFFSFIILAHNFQFFSFIEISTILINICVYLFNVSLSQLDCKLPGCRGPSVLLTAVSSVSLACSSCSGEMCWVMNAGDRLPRPPGNQGLLSLGACCSSWPWEEVAVQGAVSGSGSTWESW